MPDIDQIGLIGAISEHLSKRHGIEGVLPRQYNAIIKAADLIVAEFAKPYKPAYPDMGLQAWLECDDRGASSEFMEAKLVTGGGCEYAHPHDHADFGRCVKLVDAVPQIRGQLVKMVPESKHWKSLVENWHELERLYREEVPTGKSPRLAARMKELYAGIGEP